MSTFEYSHPEQAPAPKLEGLSEAARHTLTNYSLELNPVQHLLESRKNRVEVTSMDVLDWAAHELEKGGVFSEWQKYESLLPEIPRNLADLIDKNPDVLGSLNKLYEVKIALEKSDETTPDDINIGDSMNLILIPWNDLRKNFRNLPDWLQILRRQQGILPSPDLMNALIIRTLKDNGIFYRQWNNSNVYVATAEYLNHKFAQFGSWGVMLAQTTSSTGIKKLAGYSPSVLTDKGREHLRVAKFRVSDMGVLEWLMLTLQKDPKQLATPDGSWLLANHLVTENGLAPEVPFGNCWDEQVITNTSFSDRILASRQPRLGTIL